MAGRKSVLIPRLGQSEIKIGAKKKIEDENDSEDLGD